MFSSEFIWCDLSTFDIARAKVFYKNVFGWTENSSSSFVDSDYTFHFSGAEEAAGIFTMPQILQNIGMPSFWMSYVQVAALSDSLDYAIKLGAKCEIEPTSFDSNSRYALIRDPSGAGFTLYEGPHLQGRSLNHGRMSWNELHVPKLEQIEEFYCGLLGWNIVRDPQSSDRHTVKSPNGVPIASILEIDESIKGPKNYWAIYFSVHNIDVAINRIIACGGDIVVSPNESDGDFALVVDDQGAAFCVAESMRVLN